MQTINMQIVLIKTINLIKTKFLSLSSETMVGCEKFLVNFSGF